MLQQDIPDDYVIATGKMVSVREFIELCGKKLGWNKNHNEPAIIWEGYGINEIGRRADTKEVVIKIDKRYFRPTEVDTLLGDARKAKKILKWKPRITFNQMIKEMVESDYTNQKKLIS